MYSKQSIIIIISIIAFAAILYFFNPEDTIWLPKCPFYVLTGYQCPACGGQRAIFQLLHGNLKEAFFFNPFLVISLPYAVLLILVTWFIPKDKCVKLRKVCYHRITALTYVAVFIVWWIVRNILQV